MLVWPATVMKSVTGTLSSEIDRKLKTWIEELLPDHSAAGAQPLDLEELQISLGASNDRGARKKHGSRAA